MAELSFESPASRCYGCLSSDNDRRLQTYYIKKLMFKTMLQMDKLVLCYLCKKVAIQTEKFIHNVETSQALIADSNINLKLSSKSYKTLIHPLINLECTVIPLENVIGIKSNELEEQFIKEEFGSDDITAHFITDTEIKKEEEVQDLENDFETVIFSYDSNSPRRDTDNPIGKVYSDTSSRVEDLEDTSKRKEDGDKHPITDIEQPKTYFSEICAEIITLTKEQLQEERAQKATEKKYLEATFKCEDCIKAFVMKTPHENHMKLHDKARGKFECDVCKQRLLTKCQLENHYRYHLIRYKCSKCDVTRNCETSLKDHYLRKHSDGRYEYCCPVCFKQFRFRSSLSKHKVDKHETRPRIECKYCDKTFASESAIGYHLKFNHTAEESAVIKPNTCAECGRSFKMLQKLKAHMVTHSTARDHYCVECDKSFKTRTALNLHFKTVVAHNLNKKNGDIQENTIYSCPQCDKRFPQQKALRRHVSNMHSLSLSQCSQCGKTFKSKKRLSIHILTHDESFEQHKKYCCSICNKRFYEKGVLRKHMNIHTGEKPFQCSHCPAQFTHSGSRYNHIRLVHLNLTRKGTPKPHRTLARKQTNSNNI